MFTIHSSVLKQVLIIIIWFVCYFYFSSLCFNYFCQVSALTKQALAYSAHLLYSEPPATQLISFEVAFVPILQRSGRARALPFVKVGLQKGRVTLAELAPCPGRARALASTSAVCPTWFSLRGQFRIAHGYHEAVAPQCCDNAQVHIATIARQEVVAQDGTL